ncbi:MAG: iron ABC transporter permease [Desulfobacteraceae bacterium]|nr:MAG: iron ABC transporter permease [Desulfobacteraceae bacterium]
MDRTDASVGFGPVLAAGLIPFVFLGLFYCYPVISIFFKSFTDAGSWNGSSLIAVFTSKRMINILWFTCWQAGLSTMVTLIVGLPCAYFFSTYQFRFKQTLLTLSTIPFVLPTVVVAAAFQALIGDRGIIATPLFSHPLFMIIMAHVFYNFSVVLRIISGYWSQVSSTYADAARTLGAHPIQVFFRVHLPLIRPAILASALLVFMYCFCSFGVILILGGPKFSTIEVEIYRQAAHLFNLPMAAALSLVQIVFTFLLMWGYTRYQRKTAAPASDIQYVSKPCDRWYQKGSVLLCGCFIILFTGAPMIALFIKSIIHDGQVSLIYYRSLFDNPTHSLFYIHPVSAIKNSLIFSLVTLIIAGVVGMSSAYTIHYSPKKMASVLDPLFMLPLSTSAVTLGFGIIISLDRSIIDLRTSPALIPITHSIIAFPFVLRTVLPAIQSIPISLREASHVLGAGRFKTFMHVELPIIIKALTTGSVFAFTISLGEFGATVFTARPEYSTMPMAIFRFLGNPGHMNYGQAMAVSFLLMCMTGIGFVLIERVSGTHRGIF